MPKVMTVRFDSADQYAAYQANVKAAGWPSMNQAALFALMKTLPQYPPGASLEPPRASSAGSPAE